MAVETSITYDGELHCTAVHGPSGQKLTTDAPTDNGGKGEYFSPTDLVGVSMAACMATIMALAARRKGLEEKLRGMKIRVTKEMTEEGGRRIAALRLVFSVPGAFSPAERKLLENAALGCPVRRSLRPEVETPLEFIWSK